MLGRIEFEGHHRRMNEINRLRAISLHFDNPVLDTEKAATGIVWLHKFMILFSVFSPSVFSFKEFRQTFMHIPLVQQSAREVQGGVSLFCRTLSYIWKPRSKLTKSSNDF
jgi:hypothetical protein